MLAYTARDILADLQTTTGLVIYLALYIGFVLVIACAAILAPTCHAARGIVRTALHTHRHDM